MWPCTVLSSVRITSYTIMTELKAMRAYDMLSIIVGYVDSLLASRAASSAKRKSNGCFIDLGLDLKSREIQKRLMCSPIEVDMSH